MSYKIGRAAVIDASTMLGAVVTGHAVIQWGFFIRLFSLPDDLLALDRFPLSSVKVLVAITAVLLSLLAAYAWWRPRSRVLNGIFVAIRRVRQARLWSALAIISLVAVGSGLWVYYCPLYGFISAHLFLLALILYLAAPEAWETRPTWLNFAIPGSILIVAMGLRIWFLYWEWVWTDEAYYLSLASNILQTGRIVPAMLYMPSNVIVIPIHGYVLAIYGLWAKIFGVDLFSLRWMSYLISLPVLLFMYLAVKQWYGRTAALLSTSFASLSFLFMHAILARNNALPMLMVSATLFAHVTAFQKKKPFLHSLAGILAAATLEAHPAGLVFIAAFGAYYVHDFVKSSIYERRWIRPAPLWYFTAGLIPVLVIYFYLHIFVATTPQQYFTYLSASGSEAGIAHFLAGRWQVSLYRFREYWLPARIEVIFLAASVVGALIRRNTGDRHWLFLAIATVLSYFFIDPRGHLHYLVFGLPIYFAATGPLFIYGLGSQERSLRDLLPRLAYIGVAGLLTMGVAIIIPQRRLTDLASHAWNKAVITVIRSQYPADTAILGPAYFYAYIPEYTHYVAPVPDHASGIAGIDPAEYWMNVLLSAWPEVIISHDALLENAYSMASFRTYPSARQVKETIPGLWVPSDGDMVLDAPADGPRLEGVLNLVAHARLPASASPGDTLSISMIWISRTTLADDYSIELTLRGARTYTETFPMMSDWARVGTTGWGSYEFHNVIARLEIPEGLSAGDYALLVEVQSPAPPPLACAPRCIIELSHLTILP